MPPSRLGGAVGESGGLQHTALHLPPFPSQQILQGGTESSRHQLLIEACVAAGRVDNITTVMGLHPQYLSSFWKTQYLLLRMDGPLPYHKRHYIAIMVRMGGPLGLGGSPGGTCGPSTSAGILPGGRKVFGTPPMQPPTWVPL